VPVEALDAASLHAELAGVAAVIAAMFRLRACCLEQMRRLLLSRDVGNKPKPQIARR
jgi:hypothetical protein